MKKIEAQIVADSISPQGHRITSFLLTFPRFILAELNTHRLFSRNSASSRAIPFEKMVKMVKEDPFIPIAWQKDHKGMQGTEYLTEEEATTAEVRWIAASHNAITSAKMLNNNYFGVQRPLVTKQLCNRLLEPFMWHTALVTATEFENFFELRCPRYLVGEFRSKKDANKAIPDLLPFGVHDENDIIWWLNANKSQAEIHIQALAEAMWDKMNENTPKELEAGEWHIPFGDKMDDFQLKTYLYNLQSCNDNVNFGEIIIEDELKIKVAIARCARLSYMTHDGEIDYEKDIKMHDSLLLNRHMSPFEHCAKAMTENEYNNMFQKTVPQKNHKNYFVEHIPGWCNNFRGWIQYRYLVE